MYINSSSTKVWGRKASFLLAQALPNLDLYSIDFFQLFSPILISTLPSSLSGFFWFYPTYDFYSFLSFLLLDWRNFLFLGESMVVEVKNREKVSNIWMYNILTWAGNAYRVQCICSPPQFQVPIYFHFKEDYCKVLIYSWSAHLCLS